MRRATDGSGVAVTLRGDVVRVDALDSLLDAVLDFDGRASLHDWEPRAGLVNVEICVFMHLTNRLELESARSVFDVRGRIPRVRQYDAGSESVSVCRECSDGASLPCVVFEDAVTRRSVRR